MDTNNPYQTNLPNGNNTNSLASGTNPDRYANIYTVAEAEKISKLNLEKSCSNSLLVLNDNISTLERLVSIAAGTYLLSSGLFARKKSIFQSVAGTALLARGIAGYCPVYKAIENIQPLKSSAINIRTSVNIDKPIDEVYDFYRKLANLPLFMSHLKSVEEKNDTYSHWVAKGPAGIGTISWDAKILLDEPGRILSWTSLPGSTVDNTGKIVFKQRGSNGTELDVTISYHAPLGIAGEAVGKLFNPVFEKMVRSDIENLKTYLETVKV